MAVITQSHLNQLIKDQHCEDLFLDIYGEHEPGQPAIKRMQKLIDDCDFEPSALFSAPGRTELGGNHTDHNLGKVLCAAVREDTLAAVSLRDDNKIIINSEGFRQQFEIDVAEVDPRSEELGTTTSLIRGVTAGIVKHGGRVGGFNARVTSSVGVGSGLSSSASFEVLIGTILNDLYNAGKIPPEKIARIGQFAENEYFGKPCGLMDQTASAVGGILEIDFESPDNLKIRPVKFDMTRTDYTLLVINTGSTHTDLTYAYASIPEEMREVAKILDVGQLREIEEDVFLDKIVGIRKELGDRAVLRALHFYRENARVDQMAATLEEDDFEVFLSLVSASGESSRNILQNAIPPHSDGKEQGLAFALGISQLFFEQTERGVARVHGGGFAGTIQAYVHSEDIDEYSKLMSTLLGPESVKVLQLREHGASRILQLS